MSYIKVEMDTVIRTKNPTDFKVFAIEELIFYNKRLNKAKQLRTYGGESYVMEPMRKAKGEYRYKTSTVVKNPTWIIDSDELNETRIEDFEENITKRKGWELVGVKSSTDCKEVAKVDVNMRVFYRDEEKCSFSSDGIIYFPDLDDTVPDEEETNLDCYETDKSDFGDIEI